MLFGTIVFTVLAAATTFIQAAPVSGLDADLDHCKRLFDSLDENMTYGEAELPDDIQWCTANWSRALRDCHCESAPKRGEIPQGYETCFDEMFLKYREGLPKTKRDQSCTFQDLRRGKCRHT